MAKKLKTILRINNENEFEEYILNTSGLLLVNFWSNWSIQCHNNYNTMRKIRVFLDDKDAILYVDLALQKDLAKHYKVFGIPTLLFYFSGKEIIRYSGILSEMDMRRHLSTVKKLTAAMD